MRLAGNKAAQAAKNALSTLTIFLGAATLGAAISVAPAAANKDADAASEADLSQPMVLVVSLSSQKVEIYRGTTLVTSSRVSSGKRGYATKAGVFSILEKRRRHYSNLYNGAPMPWMQRLTWSGTAFHGGVVPGYPASHGCIRLPYSFAPKLFSMTEVGAQVVVAHGKVAPKLIEHSALFQPLPPPAPPVLAKDHEQHTKRANNEAAPPFEPGLPVVLANAESDILVTDTPPAVDVPVLEGDATEPARSSHAMIATAPMQLSASAAPTEDTRVHAIDPEAGPFVGSGTRAVAAKPSTAQDRAAAGDADDLAKHQARLTPHATTLEADSSAIVHVSATALPQPTPLASAEATVALGSNEPQAGPILSVSATALAQPVPELVSAVIKPLGPPPLPPAKPSVIAAKLVAGAAAAAFEAAEPRSTAPLRVLVTRRTKRDRLRDAQYTLSSMGYLESQNFDGTFGRLTINAIKSFQKANDMPETGAFTDDVEKKIYEVAGKEQPPGGHLFVRQEFASVFDTPVGFRDPGERLGTHIFMVQNFAVGDTEAQWTAVSLDEKGDPTAVLDRIEIPDDVRRDISERLTPGSSLIVADTAINTAALPKGADFVVWDTSKPQVQRASVQPKPRVRRRATTRRRSTTTSTHRYRRSGGWPFF